MSFVRQDTVSLASTEDDVDIWSGSDDDSLYNDFVKLESKHEEIESTAKTTALTGPRIYALNPYEIAKVIEHDSKMERDFFSNINSLHSLLFVCDKAIAIYHNVNSKAIGRSDAPDGDATGLEVSRSYSSKVGDDKSQKVVSKSDDKKVGKFKIHYPPFLLKFW